jgi:hypothetical protein
MKLELVNKPEKVTRTAIMVDLEDAMVTIGRKSKIFPVINYHTNETVGYYVTGDLYLGADTIVNTKKGAIGEPVEILAKEGFIKSEEFDFSHTKSISISDKEFREIEKQAYRYFEKVNKSYALKESKTHIRGYSISWPDNLTEVELFVYLFKPEQFLLIKKDLSLILINELNREIIVCDKKKNNYIEVKKGKGVLVHNKKGEVVKVNSANGVYINGKNIHEIISSALHPLTEAFDRFTRKRKF